MKPAGGIKTAKHSLQFLIAVKETLGDAWLTRRRYRFGASSLLNDLLRRTGSGGDQDGFHIAEPVVLNLVDTVDQVGGDPQTVGDLGQPATVGAVLATQREKV